MKRMTPTTRSRVGLMGLVALALAATAVPLPVAAQIIEREAADAKPETVQGTIGMRGTLIRSTGFDPFSTSDMLPQISLSVEHPFPRQGAFGVAAGVGMDYGEANADARGTPSTFKAWRLSVVLEGRYYPRPYAYAFARVAPGMLRAAAVLNDTSSPNGNQLADHFDLPAVDGSAGAAFRLSGPANPVAAWLCVEAGYGWARSHHLFLAPAAPERDQAKLAPVDLGTIDPRGAFMRLALAITY
jgi:hypothetical protein